VEVRCCALESPCNLEFWERVKGPKDQIDRLRIPTKAGVWSNRVGNPDVTADVEKIESAGQKTGITDWRHHKSACPSESSVVVFDRPSFMMEPGK